MAIPSSGPVSFSAIQTEFGGSNPIGLNEYYAGGANVPSGTSGTYGAVPTSGTISVRNFYGTSDVIQGQATYTTPGTYSWTAPAGVTSVSAISVGGGGAGGPGKCGQGGGGGGGGGLTYANNISVTPGVSYTVVVGAGSVSYACTTAGGTSYANFVFCGSSQVPRAQGGGSSGSDGAGQGGDRTTGSGGGRGGNGGCGASSSYRGSGGGGAGGFADACTSGGRGGNIASGKCSTAGVNGAGGGGGGARYAVGQGGSGAGGGGVGYLGQGSSGAAGANGVGVSTFCSAPVGGGGGSGGSNGQNGTQGGQGGNGGNYGGGGGGNANQLSPRGQGAGGFVRIIWPGTTRYYPSTNTGNV